MAIGSTSVMNVAPGRVVIHTYGLRELSKLMSQFDIDVTRMNDGEEATGPISRVFAAELRDAVRPIADLAQSYAAAFAETGAFAGSISVTGGRSGVGIRSSDPGAGPIEFAGAGNRYAPIGSAPRSLFKAIDEGIDEAEGKVRDAVERALQEYLARDFAVPDGVGV